ncbi:MAG: hypothetical protein KDC26_00580 [Armatimonadetes bacterium]|nr:hypothetical protein [Armatimonadota bacterium]
MQNDQREILERAEELAGRTEKLLENRPELKEMVDAAVESGLPRESVMEALRERLMESEFQYKEGELVFAISEDECWYPAVYLGQSGNRIRLRYMSGGEGVVGLEEVKPFHIKPGMKIQAYSNMYKTWTDAKVNTYNPDSRSVQCHIWYSEESVSIEKVRLVKNKPQIDLSDRAKNAMGLAFVTLMAAGVGALIMFIIQR